jgi:hypothetical protein
MGGLQLAFDGQSSVFSCLIIRELQLAQRSRVRSQTAKVRIKKVCLKKNDLSWNLSGGAQTQGQTALHKEISLLWSARIDAQLATARIEHVILVAQ